jgi:hypothetical protein
MKKAAPVHESSSEQGNHNTRQPESDEERISNQSFNNEEGQQDGSVNLAKPSSMSYVKQNVEGPCPQLRRVASYEESYGRQYIQDARVFTNITPSPLVLTYSPAAKLFRYYASNSGLWFSIHWKSQFIPTRYLSGKGGTV